MAAIPEHRRKEREALEAKPAWLGGVQDVWKREKKAPFMII